MDIANMEVADIYEALGLSMPEEGEKEQESVSAEPAASENTEGEKEQESVNAEPADTENDLSEDGGADDESEAETDADTDEKPEDGAEPESKQVEKAEKAEKPEQSAEERRKFAAARRRAELEQAAEKAAAAERAKIAEIIKGLQIPKPGEESGFISDISELQSLSESREAQDFEQSFADGTLTHEQFQRAIISAVSKAIAPIRAEGTAGETEAGREAAGDQGSGEAPDSKFLQKVQAELAEIASYEPGVKTPLDLINLPKGEQIAEKIQQGYSYIDAYKSVYADTVAAKTAEAAAKRAAALQSSKGHLQKHGARGSGAVSVPKDQLKLFRELNPTATEAEILKYWNSYKNKT